MIVGIIGSGGREHAICHSLYKSKRVSKIYCFPGNAGTSNIAENVDFELDNFEEIKDFLPFDLVLSDMAPNISGIRERDDALMMELVDKTLQIVDELLKTKGSTLIKVFQGESLDYTRDALSVRFNKVKISKPKASRSNSKEIYIIGKELKNYE